MDPILVLFLFLEKPNADVVDKHADVIVDLLLSTSCGPDDFEFIAQIFNIIREILDCDKSKCDRQVINQNIPFFLPIR